LVVAFEKPHAENPHKCHMTMSNFEYAVQKRDVTDDLKKALVGLIKLGFCKKNPTAIWSLWSIVMRPMFCHEGDMEGSHWVINTVARLP